MWTSTTSFHRYEHILTEGRNFKTFLKESYAVALDSCYIFNKKNNKNEKLNMMLIALMESGLVG